MALADCATIALNMTASGPKVKTETLKYSRGQEPHDAEEAWSNASQTSTSSRSRQPLGEHELLCSILNLVIWPGIFATPILVLADALTNILGMGVAILWIGIFLQSAILEIPVPGIFWMAKAMTWVGAILCLTVRRIRLRFRCYAGVESLMGYAKLLTMFMLLTFSLAALAVIEGPKLNVGIALQNAVYPMRFNPPFLMQPGVLLLKECQKFNRLANYSWPCSAPIVQTSEHFAGDYVETRTRDYITSATCLDWSRATSCNEPKHEFIRPKIWGMSVRSGSQALRRGVSIQTLLPSTMFTFSQRVNNLLGALYLERRNVDRFRVTASNHRNNGAPHISSQTDFQSPEIFKQQPSKILLGKEKWTVDDPYEQRQQAAAQIEPKQKFAYLHSLSEPAANHVGNSGASSTSSAIASQSMQKSMHPHPQPPMMSPDDDDDDDTIGFHRANPLAAPALEAPAGKIQAGQTAAGPVNSGDKAHSTLTAVTAVKRFPRRRDDPSAIDLWRVALARAYSHCQISSVGRHALAVGVGNILSVSAMQHHALPALGKSPPWSAGISRA